MTRNTELEQVRQEKKSPGPDLRLGSWKAPQRTIGLSSPRQMTWVLLLVATWSLERQVKIRPSKPVDIFVAISFKVFDNESLHTRGSKDQTWKWCVTSTSRHAGMAHVRTFFQLRLKNQYLSKLYLTISDANKHTIEAPWYTVWDVVLQQRLFKDFITGKSSPPINTIPTPQLFTIISPQYTVTDSGKNFTRRTPDMTAFVHTLKKGSSEPEPKLPLLFAEIKKNASTKKSVSTALSHAMPQVSEQAQHIFAGHPKTKTIGAIVAVGAYWTYVEFHRPKKKSSKPLKKVHIKELVEHLAPQTNGFTQLGSEESEVALDIVRSRLQEIFRSGYKSWVCKFIF